MAEYVITDGSRFIMKDFKGHYVPTSNEALADMYSKRQAEGILQNSLPKALRKIFRVEKWDVAPENIKQISKEDIAQNTEKVSISPNVQKWVDKVLNLNGLAKDIEDRQKELNQQLSQVDLELTDCDHYLEWNKLNAAQGYKISKIRQERLARRRSIKNELLVMKIISEKKIGENVADEIQAQIAGMDKRSYRPRILSELFDL